MFLFSSCWRLKRNFNKNPIKLDLPQVHNKKSAKLYIHLYIYCPLVPLYFGKFPETIVSICFMLNEYKTDRNIYIKLIHNIPLHAEILLFA